MLKNNYNFQKKIECIYLHIALRDIKTLASLFWNKKSGKLENRIIHIKTQWLKNKKDNYHPKRFIKEFKNYPISLLKIEGNLLFKNAAEFLNMPIEEFCHKIKEYARKNNNSSIIKEDEYKYLYIFYKNAISEDYKIDYYTINYKEYISPNTIAIEAAVPKSKKDLYKIDKFYGEISFYNNRVFISFENRFISIRALFNKALANSFTNYLVGVLIGIADINQKIPIAKKVILSKKKFDDINKIYPILNESEIIVADENLYIDTLSYLKKDHYLERYINRFKDFEKFFKNVSKYHFKSFYHQLALNEFYELNKILELVKNNSSYTIKERVRILKGVIKSYEYKKFDKLYIVMPVLKKNYIFDRVSSDTIEIKEELLKLSNRVNIEIIFVLRECQQEFSIEFENFLKEINKSIKIYFSNRELLKNIVNSIDFIFTNNKDFVIQKPLQSSLQFFRFFNDNISINEYESLFYKIKNRSINYDDFIKNRDLLCKINSSLIQKISQHWYLYFYVKELEEYELIINPNKQAKLIKNGKIHSMGEIINREYQSIILLDGVATKRTTTLIFDNSIFNLETAFTFKLISKEYASNKDIITIGIASKKSIEYENVKNILGDKSSVIANIELIKERLFKFI